MLQKFLNLNFIRNIEDETLSKLKKSSGALVKKFSKKKAKIISYTLIALDPEVKANSPDLNEAKNIIIKNWKTFLANNNDTAITIIRAVILEALEIISKETHFACMIWLTSRNIIKHYNLGRERELLNNFLLDLGNKIEKGAIESWSLISEANLEKASVKINEPTGIVVDQATLQKYLEDASGPTNKAGQTNYENPNPIWTNSGQTWSHEFAPRAAKGIAIVLNNAMKEQTKAFKINHSQIETLQKDKRSQLRAQLLWWKEACYSESLKQSYRELNDGLLQIALAYDYSLFLPFIYPTSVDYFLKETHRVLISEIDKRMKISEILNLIKAASNDLKAIFFEEKIEEGRLSLMNFLRGLINDENKLTQFKNLVGISSTTEISLDEFLLWIFHDLQALKITKSK